MTQGASVGIITTTKNRSEFIARLFRYLRDSGFQGSLHLGDASNDEHRARIISAMDQVEGAYEIQIVECRGLSIGESLYEASVTCSRPFSTFIGDDDYCLIPALDACSDFLKSNPDYSAAHGEGFAFTLNQEGPYGKIASLVTYPMPILEQNSPLERLNFILTHYGVTLFSVVRTKSFQGAFSNLALVKDSTFRDELIPCCLFVIEGKVKQLPICHLIRQSHYSRYQLPTVDEWIKTDDFASSAKAFETRIAEAISTHIKADMNEIKKAVWQQMSIYLARFMAQQILKIPFDLPNDPQGKELNVSEVLSGVSPYSKPLSGFIRSLTA